MKKMLVYFLFVVLCCQSQLFIMSQPFFIVCENEHMDTAKLLLAAGCSVEGRKTDKSESNFKVSRQYFTK